MTGLALLAVGSFAAGFGRQLVPAGPSPFPPPQGAALQSASVIPEATPAPDMQLAATTPTRHRAPEPANLAAGLPQITAADISPVDAPPASAADAAPAADASATAPDQPPPTPDLSDPPI
jgi:hypothetical protein